MCILRGSTAPKREFGDFLEYINDRFTELIEDAPQLHAAGQQILNNVQRSRPSPIDSFRSSASTGATQAGPEGLNVPGENVMITRTWKTVAHRVPEG